MGVILDTSALIVLREAAGACDDACAVNDKHDRCRRRRIRVAFEARELADARTGDAD